MVNLSIVETKAVIIKTQDFKENDKLVWFYTEKLGKITAIVRGAKKSKSKFLALTLPLCYGEYMVYKGKSLYTLQEGKIIQSFQGLLNNLHKLTYSSYLCELIDIACADNEINMELFKTLITTLYLLNTDALDYELLIRAFELKLLKTTGYNLTLNNCSVCRKKISSSNYISLSHYGGICDECPKEHGVFISKGAYNALRFLMNMDIDKLYRLNLNHEIKSEIEKVITFLVSNSYAKKPKSLEMLKFIKE
ncbi:DNA repair protein RecO [Clostridium beijerinckii]|uniref:DNA repair protein RecO n=1 Tax=Clostridium beijerinckii TaxID=1520 RepID=UPI00098C205E|nr:DNA repair protein RecO [Clostridium beijerinckii]MBA8936418.1 DNA repair protein RecO (recombination protein O) [Clostridium beijerinckii]NRT33178.1 DNA repair protein RecO (recombination protein O) [Clostridium beijerinckii]NRT47396.1 DNA repair protein RecO (recombination protein O) [Clostridium beijerinckii]NRT75472.1 DNA repair protein RecO (recombination protein O) [Clostridium beijerinckii]NRU41113.1 DNA repair protein RecO (recombination protein O) [Clostridium beijerinckii]